MSSKFFTYFTVLLAATLLLTFLHIKGWLRPVESSTSEVARPFVYVFRGAGNFTRSFFGFFGSVSSLTKQSAALSNEVRSLQEQNVALQQYQLENEILKKELNYRQSTNLDLVSADVIAKDPTGFSQTLTLDIGANQGIKEGDAVLAQGVLVGKIIFLDQFTSKVLLITDPQSKIDAALAASGQTGVLEGSFGSGVVLSDVSQNVALNQGDAVVTAGLTDQIPKGILIGTIDTLQSKKQDLLQTAAVVPAVDLKRLEFLAVLRK